MNDSSLGQLGRWIGFSEDDDKFGAEGALFSSIEQGTARSALLSAHKTHEF
jgi:hypothetical protein